MNTPLTVLVAGATGNQGGSVARHLLERGHAVRALTRRADSPKARALAAEGATLVHGDFDDPTSLVAAASGADAVYVMGTPFGTDPETETHQSIALIDAATQGGVGHVVYASVASALENTGIPHFESKAEVETHLQSAGVSSTVLAPVAFLPELTAPDTVAALAQGHYPAFIADQVVLQHIDLEDLGAFAASVLEQPARFAGRRIELASFEVSPQEVAQRLSQALGRDVTAQRIPLEAIRQMGGEDFVRMVEFFENGGYTVDIDALHAAHPEVDWATVDRWIEGQDWAATDLPRSA